MSERNGTDQSNDGAPSVEVTEDDIFEEMSDHQDLLAASCGDDVGVEHFSNVIQAARGLLHMLVLLLLEFVHRLLQHMVKSMVQAIIFITL